MTISRNLSFLAEGASSTGVLGTANGGTNLTSFTVNGIPYASSSSVLTTGSGLQFDGSNLGINVTPNTWISTIKALEVNSGSVSASTSFINVSQNTYLATSGSYTYITTNTATRYRQGGTHQFLVAPSGTAGTAITFTTAMQIANSGGVSIGNTTDPGATNLSVTGTGKYGTTISVGAATPSASGAGITFPATQSASNDVNTLDDYEEGTWTPVVVGTTTAGTGTYGTQIGTYTKVGRAVSFTLTLAWSAHTGTGNMYISGLPFTTNATGSYSFAISCYNLTFVGQLSCYTSGGSANLSPITITTASAYSLLALDTSVAELEISGTYFV
jgi:hypothetical protein